MRLIKVSAPEGKGSNVIELAFSVGIKEVSLHRAEYHRARREVQIKDVIDIQISTPKAKVFADALLESEFYNQEEFSISTRQPRSIIADDDFYQLTTPLVEPAIDVFQELWQFSQITVSFIGRFFIAGCLLAFGIIKYQILIIIAGLLFLPILPLLLSIGFGGWTGQWKLAKQGSKALLTAIGLLFLAGVSVAAFAIPPIKYDEFNSITISFLISLAVGVAAALANTDDVGRRELIGLAATAQIAVIPVWFGVSAVFGFPSLDSGNEILMRALTFFVNILTIIISSLVVYILTGAAHRSIGKLKT